MQGCRVFSNMKDTDVKETQPRRFQETQAFATWVYGLLAVVIVPSVAALAVSAAKTSSVRWLVPADLALFVLVFDLLCVRTEVSETEVIVTFGALFPLYRRRIALSEIASAIADTYSPIAEYGGWGIKGMPSNIALNARGNRGVRLTLRNGRRVLIGSQRPEELEAALTARH